MNSINWNEARERDCRMIEKPITCVECNGKGSILREVNAWNPKRLIEIDVECPNCHGEGQTVIEVCNACSKCEDECRCLEEVLASVEREEALEAVTR